MNKEANKKKATSLSSVASSSSYPPPITAGQSTELTNKKLEEIDQYVGKDNIKVNNNVLSVETIIKRAEMIKHINYKSLSPSDIALVHYGLNCILDLTRGSLTNQCLLFSKEGWNQIKALLSTSPTNGYLSESRSALRKIDKIFKNSRNAEECYWNSKDYQKKGIKI